MNVSISKLDEDLFLTVNGSHHGFLDGIMLAASNLLSFILVFLFCTYITII